MKLTNRQRSMQAKKVASKWWCQRCDGALVGQWGRCPRCGFRENRRKKR